MDKNFLNIQPSPLALVQSLRDIGYSMETAVGKILVLDDHNLRTEVDATFTRDIGGSTQVSSQTVTAVYTR